MGPILSSLVELQVIENKVRKTNKELKAAIQRVRKQEAKIERLKGALKAKQEEIKLTRMQYDKLELDLKSREERITNMRVALNTAKTNKEYSAVLTRINTDKADNSKLEDQILGLITQIDNDKEVCKEIEGELAQETEQLEVIREEVAQRQEQIEAKLELENKERQEAYTKVPEKHGVLFDRLAERYDGEVLAVVEQRNGARGDYSCGGCYMKVPLEVANGLITRDDVISCPNCGRLLVLDKNPKQTPSH